MVFEFFSHFMHALLKLSVSVASDLAFLVLYTTSFYPNDHYIYSDQKRSLEHTFTSILLATLESAQICEGLSKETHIVSMCEDPSSTGGASSVMRHKIPIERKFYEEDVPPFQAHVFIRSEHCELLCNDISWSYRIKKEKSLGKMKESTIKKATEPLKSNAPLSGSSKERLIATV